MSVSPVQNVFLFSGQGTQYYHMGAGLRQAHAGFARTLGRYAQVADEVLGTPLLRLLYDPKRTKSEDFVEPRNSNVALLTLECALAATLRDEGIHPHVVCGMSLGEYAAAVSCGSLDFAQALGIVAATGATFARHCNAGAILAVVDQVSVLDRIGAKRRRGIEIIFRAQGSHFVVAGENVAVRELRDHFRLRGVVCQRLPVAFGYHSANIDPAQGAYLSIVSGVRFSPLGLPFYSSAAGGQVRHLDGEHFWRTARGPMLLGEAVAAIPSGVQYRFIDLGPTGTIANVLRRHRAPHEQSSVFPIVTPFANGAQNLEKLRAHLHSELTEERLPSAEERPPENRQFSQGRTTAARQTSVAWVFPGQGSQTRGMGRELFARFPRLVEEADSVLGYDSRRLCLEDPDRCLNKTEFTQPALFLVNALYFHRHQDESPLPAIVAGHSLGEYSALYAAGALDFASGLRLVRERGELMAKADNGGMAAVLGLDEKRIREVLLGEKLQGIDIANLNGPFQTVISGPRRTILEAESVFVAAGCQRYLPLNVSGAFHSRLMRGAGAQFAEIIKAYDFFPPRMPVLANCSARPYDSVSADIRENLVKQMSQTVRWTQILDYFADFGAGQVVEVGPGKVLAKVVASYVRTTGRLSGASVARPSPPVAAQSTMRI